MNLRQSSAAAQRNRDPILEVVRQHAPARGTALEIASGTGEHIVHFACHLRALDWQPTDPMHEARQSIAAWIEHSGLANIRPPLHLDAAATPWAVDAPAMMLCINMLHISPWPATIGLMKEAGRLLSDDAPLLIYGPFVEAGVDTAPSNVAFHLNLVSRNPEWGLRDVSDVERMAQGAGLALTSRIAMPANNLMLIFRKS